MLSALPDASREQTVAGWFCEAANGQRGPMPPEALRRLVAAGEITPDTVVWCPTQGVEPMPFRATVLAASTGGPPAWHYERAGTRVGPVPEPEMHRLIAAGDLTLDTLVWSPGVGSGFLRLGDTALAPTLTAPPALPAHGVDDTLAWVLAAVPLAVALLERASGQEGGSVWGWPLATFVACSVLCLIDEKRVARSGAVLGGSRLAAWAWLVPAYLYQRARVLRGPKLYVWAWGASFVAALAIGGGDVATLFNGDTYLGFGVPICSSAFEQRQVRKIFDGISEVRVAGLTSTALTNPRELGSAGDVRTCAAQITASDAQVYRVVYTVEATDGQVLTRIQLQN